MATLPHIDARFIHLSEPRALVEYATRMAELLHYWEEQERIRHRQLCSTQGLNEFDASGEAQVIDHHTSKSASFLGAQIILHAWALLEGVVKAAADFVAGEKNLRRRDGQLHRLQSRKTWTDDFRRAQRSLPTEVDRWGAWFALVLSYQLPLSAEQLGQAKRLREIRNSIGHELLDEPSATEARLQRMVEPLIVTADQSLLDRQLAEEARALMFQIESVHAFGDPPGLLWAEQVAEMTEGIVCRLQQDFPTSGVGFHAWARPPLSSP